MGFGRAVRATAVCMAILLSFATPKCFADASVALLTGKVLFMRHALAPGNGDPDHFDLSDCETQRNLSAEGIAQAKEIGAKLNQRGIVFSEIFSSEWCRCQQTAVNLNVGEVIPFRGLNSFYEAHFSEDDLLPLLYEKLWHVESSGNPVLMVTHFVTIQAITGRSVSSGDLVLYDSETGESIKFTP